MPLVWTSQWFISSINLQKSYQLFGLKNEYYHRVRQTSNVGTMCWNEKFHNKYHTLSLQNITRFQHNISKEGKHFSIYDEYMNIWIKPTIISAKFFFVLHFINKFLKKIQILSLIFHIMHLIKIIIWDLGQNRKKTSLTLYWLYFEPQKNPNKAF